jgi:hypothetical protein
MIEPIIVVGPGRCGTSCVAQVLQQLGVFMGNWLVGADPSNPWGHFEDVEFLKLNESWLKKQISQAQWSAGVESLITQRRALGKPWGWKDPRTSELLRHYLEFFNDPKFVRCIRPAEDIEASVVRAYGTRGWTPQHAHALRERRERELDRFLPWYQTITIDFDQLRSNREEYVELLIDFCGLSPLPEWRFQAAVQSIRPSHELVADRAPGVA